MRSTNRKEKKKGIDVIGVSRIDFVEKAMSEAARKT